MNDILEELRTRIIDSDLTPRDLRIALEIVDEVKHESESDE